MEQERIIDLVKKIMDTRYLLEPTDKLIMELQSLVTFSEVGDLFFTDRSQNYISDRIIDYEKRKKITYQNKN